ncbi:hypothetical protein [Sporosarcina highlanderae]|uniref:Uncharacterized protein n=1 Tax=Sporosarcina highlanderae TaxID=3035916 RepID=A0ABT8JXZ2_9BACL|nr:hypothetical protein [Sporosarcina highlanderae]MDN4609227.1 hypothetical protein [Sporosarcina highlanderae]
MALRNSVANDYGNTAVFEELLVDLIKKDFIDNRQEKAISKLFHYVVAKIEEAGINTSLEENLEDLRDYIIEVGEASAILLRQIAESVTISNETLQRIRHLNKLYFLGESVLEGRYEFHLNGELNTMLKSFAGRNIPHRLLEKSSQFFSLLAIFRSTCFRAGVSTKNFEELCKKILNQLQSLSTRFEADAIYLEVDVNQHDFSVKLDQFHELLLIVIDGFRKFTMGSVGDSESNFKEFSIAIHELPSFFNTKESLKEIVDYLEGV